MRHPLILSISCALLLGMLASATVHASFTGEVASAPGTQAAAGHVLDPGFNGGGFILDRFAGPNTANYRGRKVARSQNGDIIAVGLVPPYNQPDQPNGYFNIGLVRYDATGRRVAWAWNSAYGHYNNEYLIYPGGETSGQLPPRFTAVKDLKVFGKRIYVLVDNEPTAGDSNTHLLVFTDNGADSGRFLGHYNMSTAPTIREYGAGLAVMPGLLTIAPDRLVVAMTQFDASGPYVTVRRYIIGGANPVEPDTAFGDNGSRHISLTRAAGGCAPSAAVNGFCPLQAYSIDIGHRGLGSGASPIYIGAERQYSSPTASSNDWDVAVIKLDSNGTLQTSFGTGTGNGGGNGFAFVQFERGRMEDRIRGIHVRTTGLGLPNSPYRDELYVVASISQECAAGVGIGKLDASGQFVSSFGAYGKVRFGGWDDPGDAQACAVYNATRPFAVARAGDTLAIAGQSDAYVWGDFLPSAAVGFVDIDDGSVLPGFTHAVTPPWASFPSTSTLYGIIANDDGSFTVTGDAGDTSTGNTLLFATARITSDSIFADGFQ